MARLYLPKNMTIETFTNHHLPSTLEDYSWIQVYSSKYKDQQIKERELFKKGERLMNLNLSEIQSKRKEIDKLAKETNCISGKWMLKIKPEHIDEAWKAIAKGVDSSAFGDCISAKVSSPHTNLLMDEPDVHTVCIYTNNYFDEREVFAVRNKLTDLKIDKVCEPKIYYKPEIFTYLRAMGEKDKYRHATYICIQ